MNWISTNYKRRLPKESKAVLIHNKDSMFGGVYIAERWNDKRDAAGYHWSNGTYGEISANDVTHWMPLPEPPKQ